MPFSRHLHAMRMVKCQQLGGSKVDAAVHPSEIDKMSTKDFWELSGKK